jgi:glycosyltransferase involved in cell wall biosynthesis
LHVGVFLGDHKPDVGGGYTFVQDVVATFLAIVSESGHRFTLFCHPLYAKKISSGSLPNNLRIEAIEPRGFIETRIAALRHYAPVFGYFWKRLCKLEVLARCKGIEVMWFIGGFYDTLDMPYIATVWDVQHLTHPWFPEVSARWEWDYREMFLSRHLRRAAHVITGTEVGRSELMHYYRLPSDRIAVLPHPTPSFALNAEECINKVALRQRFDLGDPFVLYPAQFWPHKNHANLLLAFRHMLDCSSNCPYLALVGSDKGNRSFVQELSSKLELDHRVRILGFVSTDDLIALYRSAAAMIYPSFSGPENLPPLEAFALGCPVVMSDFPGAREQLGDAAVFFDPSCPISLASRLIEVLDQPVLRDTLRQRGFVRAASWTTKDYVRGVFNMLDGFDPIRRCWA